MQISFDAAKNQVNIDKHGVPLSLANDLEWDSLLAIEDQRKDYGEARMIGFAYLGHRLYNVIFTDRDEFRRVISLRKANPKEVKYYGIAKNISNA